MLRRRTTYRTLMSLAVAVLATMALMPAPSARPSTSEPGFFVARFESKISDRSRAALEATGLTVVDYEHPNSYLVWGSPGQAKAGAGLRAIRSVSRLQSQRKLDVSLVDRTADIGYAQVSVYGPALNEAASFLSRFGRIFDMYVSRADGLLATIALPLPASALDTVLAHPAVIYVGASAGRGIPEDEMTSQIMAGNISNEDNRAELGYRDWLQKTKLDGSGVLVSVVDTGVEEMHPDFQDRVEEEIDYSLVAEPVDTDGHGTHVAGIIGGFPGEQTSNLHDPDGFLYGQGVAPGVRYVVQNAIGTTHASFPPEGGFETLTSAAWDAGAFMWNASWTTGEGARAGYVENAKVMDELARNAVFDKKGREEFLLVFSAGNSGAAGATAPKEAKNLIAVGSTLSGRGLTYPQTTDIDAISSFSSRGPTVDGRIFPTISAPGENVISTRAPEGSVSYVLGACAEPIAFPLYCSLSGTSMAAPHVTGAAALIHQWWKPRHKSLPSPPMVKALLVNSASDIALPDIPNINEGWGRVNLGELFSRTPAEYVDQEVTFGGKGERKSYTVEVKDSSEPLKITLAWADAPAAAGAKVALVNDLDLSVEMMRGGRVVGRWRGNVFETGVSVPGGAPDRLNNLENVYLLQPVKGTYRITINAINVPGDGVPENGDKTDQDFALVIRGGL